MQLTYYGHACFAVDLGGTRLLFDPFISPNPLAKDVDVNAIEADYILISHGHADHIADAVAIATRTGATVISAFEIVQWLGTKGVTNAFGMNLGGSAPFPFGRVKYVPALHSSTLPDGTPGGNPGGFVVTSQDSAFYYAGDTALTYDMKLIGESFTLDFAVLPIGDVYTMGIDDAVRAAQFVGARTVLGVHYDTFPPIAIDREAARTEFARHGMELVLPEIGQTVTI
jgi:L-ascorbate metabolism protein UlaG (beta-lactamase superfamily)